MAPCWIQQDVIIPLPWFPWESVLEFKTEFCIPNMPQTYMQISQQNFQSYIATECLTPFRVCGWVAKNDRRVYPISSAMFGGYRLTKVDSNVHVLVTIFKLHLAQPVTSYCLPAHVLAYSEFLGHKCTKTGA